LISHDNPWLRVITSIDDSVNKKIIGHSLNITEHDYIKGSDIYAE